MESDERPWTEEQWEAMFRRSDARSAKYGELFETFADDPDADEKIAREMGWSHMLGEEGPQDGQRDPEFEAWKQEVIESAIEAAESGELDDDELDDDVPWEDVDEAPAAESEESEEDAEAFFAARCDRLRKIDAYRLAFDTGLLIHGLLQPYMALVEDEFADEPTERLINAYSHSLRAAAKIAGGHGIGYTDDAICGNIVCNRIALESVQITESELAWLRNHGRLPPEIAAQCLVPLAEVRVALEARIAELRKKVWW
jgi:hypothetical protein